MKWIQFFIFFLIVHGLFLLFRIRMTDVITLLIPSTKTTLKDDFDTLLGKPPKGFFNRETIEIEQLLTSTGREHRFTAMKQLSVLLFLAGAFVSVLINNVFLIPVLGVLFAFAPGWYLRSTAAIHKKHLNEELETAVSVITTSYMRSGDLIKAMKENIPYLNPPVKNHFEAFLTETEMINSNIISAINTLKMKIANRIFHEWCNTLIQCQSDRTMKDTLTFTVQKFSDVRVVQSELEAIISQPKKEAFMMMFLVLCNVPLLYFLNKNWFHTLIFTTPGKLTLAICSGLVLFAATRIMALSKPIEYKG